MGAREARLWAVPRAPCPERYGICPCPASAVLATGAALDAQPVQDALAQKLAKNKLPKRVIFVADLPRNAMGKVQKNVLRERFGVFM
jgi:acyl-CoA synthetase (AMP-forming)/AMP-acid ligase II